MALAVFEDGVVLVGDVQFAAPRRVLHKMGALGGMAGMASRLKLVNQMVRAIESVDADSPNATAEDTTREFPDTRSMSWDAMVTVDIGKTFGKGRTLTITTIDKVITLGLVTRKVTVEQIAELLRPALGDRLSVSAP